jgi:UDP:flavonoid glycosyltransferase YjiC (YdhE family)
VHVTQGTIRTDPAELLLPTIEALADEDLLVVATTGGCDPSELGPLPGNARAASFIPYELLLARASAFVTNGGFIGTNLALHHGVPVIQVGRTEEKAENGARIEYAGVGLRFGRRPSARRLRDAVQYVLTDRTVRANVGRLSEQYQLHDAPTEAAALLVELAAASSRAGQDIAGQDIAERSTLPA